MIEDAPMPAARPYAGRVVHFIGIGGCGMSGLAEFVLVEGGRVSGSDVGAGAVTDRLARLGATVRIGHDPGHVPPDTDTVVVTAAVKPDNVELAEARRRGLPILKYAEFLGRLMALRQGIAVSGTHGKSTTTALLAWVLSEAGLDPSFVVGAEAPQLGGGARVGGGPHLVAEACEFDRSFLRLGPRAACILNVEEDHLDCYRGGLGEIREAFAEFASRVSPGGPLVVNGAETGWLAARAARQKYMVTFGIGGTWDWRAEHLEPDQGRYAFQMYHGRSLWGHVRLALAGRHNVLNALAAAALAHWAGARADRVVESLGTFQGVRRRMEVLGEAGGVTVIDDYAHHPTEIAATLRAARERFEPGRLWVVFQPHQHSRTRFLLKDFALALSRADRIIVPDIYFVRDSENERQAVRSEDLVQLVQAQGAEALYIPEFQSIRRYLVDSLRPGDALLVMGAGDIGRLAAPLLQCLGAPDASPNPPGGGAVRSPQGLSAPRG